jgi:phosphoribosylformylglycinamidine cyclo-ligase
VLPLVQAGLLHGIAHLTGGGFYDNIPRVLPDGCRAVVDPARWSPPPLFRLIQRAAAVPDAEMYHVFNMGIGLVLVVAHGDLDHVCERLHASGESPVIIGRISAGDRGVEMLGEL